MSLPPAPKDISNKPASGSVTDPVNKQAKDADVDRKLRLYGIIEAFRRGRLPSNDQIDQTLQYVLDHSPVDVDRLSPDGKKLVQDTHDIIETARLMVQEKNADELFQQFVWHTRDIDSEAVREGMPGKEGVPLDREKMDSDSQLAVQHLRTLLSLVLTNSEVRKLFSDFSLIGRDLLSTGLQKASGHIAPSKDALAHVDSAGPQDEFITEGGRPAGPGETPVLEARVPGTGVSVKQDPKEGGARIRGEGGEERGVGEVKETLGQEKGKAMEGVRGEVGERTGVDPGDREQVKGAAGQAGRQGMEEHKTRGEGQEQQSLQQSSSQARDVGSDAAQSGLDKTDTSRLEKTARGIVGDERVERATGGAQDIRDSAKQRGEEEAQQRERAAGGEDVDVERKKGGFMGRMRGVRDNLTDRMPQEERDRLERGKKFLSEEYFPPERREQFIYRGKKVIIECQKHEDYQEALRWLLSYIEEYAAHGRSAAHTQKEGVRGVSENKSLKRAITEIRTLLERFANGKSMEMILDAFSALRDDAHRDKELRDWFKAVDQYMRKVVLLEPGYVLEPDCNSQANRLRDGGRQFYDVKYKGHFDHLFNNISDWFRAMGDDPTNVRFGEDWARLTRDLLFDSEGSLKFKKELWNDIRKVILPQLVDKVGYIPIPRIEYTDDSLDLVVENLTLSGRNLFPNVVALEAHNFVRFSPYNAITDESRHRFTLTFGQMQADMRDVAFYYKKKTGVPRMSDSGLADVVVGGEGLTATVVLVSAGKDRSSVFKVQDVHVKVAALKFSIRDSKHDFLYKTLKPLATALVKRQIQKAMADAIHTGLEYVDGQLVSVRDRMESAKSEGGEGRAQKLQELFKRKKEEVSTKPSTSSSTLGASHSQFKVVSNKRNSLLSSAGHPAGWVNRTAEKEELAEKGEEWRSEAFTIVK
ncbi:hypothetical protein D9615_010299 [Tricholomella constricta]|uniref:Uncharacterized protein n=1 Tax=Tricholomella constricta TaxID=117010 RepID=A0A8H5GPW8_9AGAR|nr:hypothetical protein D9615_010299 [Tricholomella constricta]